LIKIKVMDILESKERNITWLSKKTGIGYSTMYNFVMEKTNAVNYKILNDVCVTLECELKDIIEYIKEEDAK